jgi:hypothetical protein
MEIPDEWDVYASLGELIANVRHSFRCLVTVDRDAHKLGARTCQRRDLLCCCCNISRVGVGHRLDDNRMFAADPDAANLHAHRRAPRASEIAHQMLLDLAPFAP